MPIRWTWWTLKHFSARKFFCVIVIYALFSIIWTCLNNVFWHGFCMEWETAIPSSWESVVCHTFWPSRQALQQVIAGPERCRKWVRYIEVPCAGIMRGTCLDFSRLPWLSSRLKMKLLSSRPGGLAQRFPIEEQEVTGSIDRADVHFPLTWLTMINWLTMFLWAFWEFCDLDLCRTSGPYLCQEETVSQVVQTSKYYDHLWSMWIGDGREFAIPGCLSDTFWNIQKLFQILAAGTWHRVMVGSWWCKQTSLSLSALHLA